MSKVFIGKRYFETLEIVRNYLLATREGMMSENIEILNERTRARCYFDKCRRRGEECDRVVRIYVDYISKQGATLSVFFHAECLEEVIRDKRLRSLN